MTEVEDLEESPAADEGHGADDHDGEHDDEDDSGGVGPAGDEPEGHGLVRQHPVRVGVGHGVVGAVLAQHVGKF